MNIFDFGFNRYKIFNKKVTTNNIARIVAEHKTSWDIVTQEGKAKAIIGQTFRKQSQAIDLPKIGDYVLLETIAPNKFKIVDVLPRFSVLTRTKSLKNKTQVLAANIDCAILTFGLDQRISLQDIRNYISLCEHSNIDLVIVLTKLDKIKTSSLFSTQVKSTFKNHLVFEISNKTGIGINSLKNVLSKDKTYILLGPSGSGKSSLINYLFQESIQLTKSTSTKDEQGKHTTTSRNMFTLPNGSIIIDSPGLRTLEVKDNTITSDLSTIEELSLQCKFSNCDHQKSDHCAVLAALENKTIIKKDYLAFIHQINPQKTYNKKRSRR